MGWCTLNRSAKRAVLFSSEADYQAFEHVLAEARTHVPMRILAYCVMPNHWHLLLWPSGDGDLSRFTKWLSGTHARRWRTAHDTVGQGAVYQSRFRCIPIEAGQHLLWVWRYIERNPLRANLVSRAELWRWSSLWCRMQTPAETWLDAGPIELPGDWIHHVNLPQTSAELEALRKAIGKGVPYGEPSWQTATAIQLGLSNQPRGRPAKRKWGLTPFYTKGKNGV